MNKIKLNGKDKIFAYIIYAILIFSLLIVAYPLIFILSASFSSPNAVISGKVKFLPVEPTTMAYKAVFQSSQLMIGFKNSLIYMIIGTSINIVMTIMAAYPLSRDDIEGRNIIMFIITFTMYFGGGLIPSYILISSLGFVDTIWALTIPGAISAYYVIIARTFFKSNIPKELTEATYIDGCSDIRLIISIILPLSKPIIAVLALMYAVGHWNAFFNALIYIDSSSKYPLQLVLRNILIQNSMDSEMLGAIDIEDMRMRQYLSELLKYAVIIVASVPMLIIYPFVQKYFIQGVMIGSLKG